jgi:hypothetical protein
MASTFAMPRRQLLQDTDNDAQNPRTRLSTTSPRRTTGTGTHLSPPPQAYDHHADEIFIFRITISHRRINREALADNMALQYQEA